MVKEIKTEDFEPREEGYDDPEKLMELFSSLKATRMDDAGNPITEDETDKVDSDAESPDAVKKDEPKADTPDKDAQPDVKKDESKEKPKEEKKESKVTPDKGQVADDAAQNLWNRIPDKFKKKGETIKDMEKALARWDKSYKNVESSYTRTSQELTQALAMLNNHGLAPAVDAVKAKATQKEEPTDMDIDVEIPDKIKENFFDDPAAASAYIAKLVSKAQAKQAMQNYDPAKLTAQAASIVMGQLAIQKLRDENPQEFELYQADLAQVLQEKKHLANPEGVRTAYEIAKERAGARLKILRERLGLPLEDEEPDEASPQDDHEGKVWVDPEKFKAEILAEMSQKRQEADDLRDGSDGVPEHSGGGDTILRKKEQTKDNRTPEETMRDVVIGEGPKEDSLLKAVWIDGV